MGILSSLFQKSLTKSLYYGEKALKNTLLKPKVLGAAGYVGAGYLGSAFLSSIQERSAAYKGRFGTAETEALSRVSGMPKTLGFGLGAAALFGVDPVSTVYKAGGDIRHIMRGGNKFVTFGKHSDTVAGILPASLRPKALSKDQIVGKSTPIFSREQAQSAADWANRRRAAIRGQLRAGKDISPAVTKKYAQATKISKMANKGLGPRPGTFGRFGMIGAGLGSASSLYFNDELFSMADTLDSNGWPYLKMIGGATLGGLAGAVGFANKGKVVGNIAGYTGMGLGAAFGGLLPDFPASMLAGIGGGIAATMPAIGAGLSKGFGSRALYSTLGAFGGGAVGVGSSALFGAGLLSNPASGAAVATLAAASIGIGGTALLSERGFTTLKESLKYTGIGMAAGAGLGLGLIGAMRAVPGASEGRIAQVYGNNQSPISRLNYSTAGLPLAMHRNRRM